jgi:hypothetical protein
MSAKRVQGAAVPGWVSVVILGLALLSAGLASAGCEDVVKGNGDTETEQRSVDAFTQLSVAGAIQAEVTIGSPQAVSVTAARNIVPLIKTEVRDSRLIVEPRNQYRTTEPVRVTITVPELSYVAATGASGITAGGIRADALTVRASGASTVRAAGSATRVDAEASGASRLRLDELTATDVRVDASGASSIEVQASGSISGEASGASSVRYGGTPRVSVSTSGASSVRPR